MEPLSVDTKQPSTDIKNELIDQAIASPVKSSFKTPGTINSNSRYLLDLSFI